MATGMPWRRLSDGKQTIAIVALADVDSDLCAAHGLVPPAGTAFARIDRGIAKVLRDAGVVTYEVGYHRGSDVLVFVETHPSGRCSREIDMARVVDAVLERDHDDDTFDEMRDDAVDAVLRVLTEGLVTERAVLVAALSPSLAPEGGAEPREAAQGERLDPTSLPEASPELVERVASALAELGSPPPIVVGPDLPPEVRRAYQRKGAILTVASLAVGLIGVGYSPWLAVLATPPAVLGLVVIVLHEAALRSSKAR